PHLLARIARTRIAHQRVDLARADLLKNQDPVHGFPFARLHGVAGRAVDMGGNARSSTRCRCDGRSTKIRTLDPRFPKPVLYQAELHSEIVHSVTVFGSKGQAADAPRCTIDAGGLSPAKPTA